MEVMDASSNPRTNPHRQDARDRRQAPETIGPANGDTFRIGEGLEWSVRIDPEPANDPQADEDFFNRRPPEPKAKAEAEAEAKAAEPTETIPKEPVGRASDSIFASSWAGLPAVWKGLRGRASSAAETLPGSVTFPWVKLAVLLASAVVLLRKDMQISFALQAPAAVRWEQAASALPAPKPVPEGETRASPPSLGEPDERAIRGYLQRFAPMAVREMKQLGIPAGLHLALGVWESRSGRFGTEADRLFPLSLPAGVPSDEWAAWRLHSQWLLRMLGPDRPPERDSRQWLEALRQRGVINSLQHRWLAGLMEHYRLWRYDSR